MGELVFKKSKNRETGLVGKTNEIYHGLICIIWDQNPATRFSRSKAGGDRANTKSHFTVAASLVDRRKIPDSRDDFGWTPLSCAAANGHAGIVEQLLERDDVLADSRDDHGRTPLSYAKENQRKGVVDALALAQ